MADFLLQATLNNLLVSSLLALLAWFIQSRFKLNSLANLLWVIVLFKMITPPLFSIPLLEVESVAAVPTSPERSEVVDSIVSSNSLASTLSVDAAPTAEWESTPEHSVEANVNPYWIAGLKFLLTAWVIGSVIVFVTSMVRIGKFHFVLSRNLFTPSPIVIAMAREVADRLELRRTPQISVTRANISPFVWWVGSSLRVVIPQSAVEGLNKIDLKAILAHEMAHIKRYDHWVRWLEWVVIIALWWNPVMWWTRKQLRVTEEIACDAIAIEVINSKRHQYASSLLNVAELLSTSAIRPPSVASAMNSGGILEKRLTMIIAEKSLQIPKWLQRTIAFCAICLFPVGLVYAQDYKAVERRLGGAVEDGELSLKQAAIMMDALKKTSNKVSDGFNEKAEARNKMYSEVVKKYKQAAAAKSLPKSQVAEQLKVLGEALYTDAFSDRSRSVAKAALQQRYLQAANKLKSAAADGSIQKTEVEKRLIELQNKLLAHDAIVSDGWSQERKYLTLEALQKLAEGEASDGWNQHNQESDRVRQIKELTQRLAESALQATKNAEDSNDNLEAKQQIRALKEKVNSLQNQLKDGSSDHYQKANDLKRRYMDSIKSTNEAVKAGDVSKKEAEEKLIKLREQLFKDISDDAVGRRQSQRKSELEALKKKYEAINNQLKTAAENGDISEEDAKRKLLEIRQKMFNDRK